MKTKLWRCYTPMLFLFVICICSTGAGLGQATGATDVDINIPDIVILHYYSNIDVTLTADALAGYLVTGATGDTEIDEDTGAGAAGGFTQNLTITPSALDGSPSSVQLTLSNAWAVRAISLGLVASVTQVSIAYTGGGNDAVLEHDTIAGADIEITAAEVDDGTSSGETITFASPGLASPQVGDVGLTLDLTNATAAGDYLNGQFTITATNI